MKHLLSIILALTLLFALPVFAAEAEKEPAETEPFYGLVPSITQDFSGGWIYSEKYVNIHDYFSYLSEEDRNSIIESIKAKAEPEDDQTKEEDSVPTVGQKGYDPANHDAFSLGEDELQYLNPLKTQVGACDIVRVRPMFTSHFTLSTDIDRMYAQQTFIPFYYAFFTPELTEGAGDSYTVQLAQIRKGEGATSTKFIGATIWPTYNVDRLAVLYPYAKDPTLTFGGEDIGIHSTYLLMMDGMFTAVYYDTDGEDRILFSDDESGELYLYTLTEFVEFSNQLLEARRAAHSDMIADIEQMPDIDFAELVNIKVDSSAFLFEGPRKTLDAVAVVAIPIGVCAAAAVIVPLVIKKKTHGI